jgi:hypothetical protein
MITAGTASMSGTTTVGAIMTVNTNTTIGNAV